MRPNPAVPARSAAVGQRRQQLPVQALPKAGPMDNGSLERAVGGLQKLANQERSGSAGRFPVRTEQMQAQARHLSPTSQGSSEDTSNWSAEVRALRNRLETIFQISGQPQEQAPSTAGTSSLNGTVGSLPTVQESNYDPGMGS